MATRIAAVYWSLPQEDRARAMFFGLQRRHHHRWQQPLYEELVSPMEVAGQVAAPYAMPYETDQLFHEPIEVRLEPRVISLRT
jgi:hypothetical protein